MTLNKKLLAGLVAFAAASSSAQAVTVAANDGWELGVSGLINQFLVFTDNDDGDDLSEVRDGLLPAFLNFDVTAPTMNGLDIAAHISFSPGTNSSSYDAFEQREVYFTVDGSFGQILMGKALGLYGSHNILTDQTLFGVGYGTGGNGETTLGGIGLGYDYASWRSQIKWTSPDMNGFKLALAVMDSGGPSVNLSGKPTGSIQTGQLDSEDLRYEADLSYAGTHENGSFSAWLSAMHQGNDVSGGADLPDDESAWTVGGTATFGGFEFMAQYSDAEGSTAGNDAAFAICGAAAGCTDVFDAAVAFGVGMQTVEEAAAAKVEWDQYIVQAGYRFGGTTLVSASYAELENKTSGATDDTIDRLTVGVYHDVNANLKLVAEYTQIEDDDSTNSFDDQEIYSIGGFVFF